MTTPSPESPAPTPPSPLRWKVVMGHGLLSLIVLAAFHFLLVRTWYPDLLTPVMAVQRVMNVLVVVFLALGPFLTAILFIPGKKGLWFDMVVVGLLQVGALGLGTELLHAERPAYLTFVIDRYVAIPASTLVAPEQLRFPELANNPLSGPSVVFVQPPVNREERARLTSEVLGGTGRDMEYRPQYYEPLTQERLGQVMNKGVDLTILEQHQPDRFPLLVTALHTWGENRDAVAFLPLFGKERDPILVGVRKSDGRLLGSVAIDPWVGGFPRAPQPNQKP